MKRVRPSRLRSLRGLVAAVCCVLAAAAYLLLLLRYLLPQAHLSAAAPKAPAQLARHAHWPPRLPRPPWLAGAPPRRLPACHHSVGSRRRTADSTGRVCLLTALGTDGCCPARLPAHRCRTGCNRLYQCCREHALCVSCCLAAHADEGFHWCSNRCRTSSSSTIGGNRYRSANVHCYFKEAPPLNLTQVVAIPSRRGESCTEACLGESKVCTEEYLPSANTCSAVSRVWQGCGACVYEDQRFAPAHSPSACVLNAKPHLLDCRASHPAYQRLCACVPPALDPNAVL